MSKIELMKNFARTFVGNDFYLIIKTDKASVLVHTIEIIQKTDDTCKIKEIPIGDYFFHILAVDVDNRQAHILCNWSEHLLQNLLTQRIHAKDAGFNKIIMVQENPDSDRWVLMWGDASAKGHKEKLQFRYIC
ncbi:MAG: hypothetical protein PVH73_02215 [Candidatus Bathyarchaeota archaeon]|jgi:hypothetical protein